MLNGRSAIVTGGSSGIGHATALELAKAGCRVAVVGRDRVRLEETLEAIRALGAQESPLAITVDVRDRTQTREMAAEVLGTFGSLDILVAAAGVGGRRPAAVVQMSLDEWDEVVDTNLRGVYLALRACLPAMVEQRAGDVVVVSSSRAATRGVPYASAYCASKHAVSALARAAGREARPHGVRVQVLLPDATDTPLLRHAGHLAKDGSMNPQCVGSFIVTMLSLPHEIVLGSPSIGPFAPAGTGTEALG